MTSERKIRVFLTKMGLDNHNRGLHVVARALREAGIEVILGESKARPARIVETAIQEDVEIVGLSLLSGSPMTLIPKVLDGLKENGAGDIIVLAGGIFLDHQISALKAAGVAEIFLPGSSTDEIVAFVKDIVAKKRAGVLTSARAG